MISTTKIIQNLRKKAEDLIAKKCLSFSEYQELFRGEMTLERLQQIEFSLEQIEKDVRRAENLVKIARSQPGSSY
jgi:hypothetical protein